MVLFLVEPLLIVGLQPPTLVGLTGAAPGINAANISGTSINTTNAPIDVVYTVTPQT
jgi:hypothetical protein